MTVDVSQTGYQFELDAILAVVIGGTSLAGGRFSLAGAAIGALLIATLDKTVVFLGIPASATPAFKAAVIIVLYVAQSRRFRGWMAGLVRRARPRRQSGRRAPGDGAVVTTAETLESAGPVEPNIPVDAESSELHTSNQPSLKRYVARHRDATSTGAALAIFIAMVDLRAGHLRRASCSRARSRTC